MHTTLVIFARSKESCSAAGRRDLSGLTSPPVTCSSSSPQVAILALLHPRLLVEKMVMEVAVKRRQPSFAFSCLSTFSELVSC